MSALLPTRQLTRLGGHNGQVHALTYSAGQATYLLTGSTDRTIRLFNPSTGRLIQKYEVHGYEVLDIAVAADNARFVSGGGDKTVFVWDVATAQTIRRYMEHVGRVESVAFGGEDASVVASASYDSTVKLWDTKSKAQKPIMTLDEARDSVTSVEVKDAEIMTGSVDGSIRSYDIRMGSMYQDVMGSSITSVTPTKDCSSLLVSTIDSTIRLMDKVNGKLLQTFKTPEYMNQQYRLRSTLGFNDSIALSGSEDGHIIAWDCLSGSVLHTLKHTNATGSKPTGEKANKKDVVSAVTICTARREWASAGADGTVVVWGEKVQS